MDWPNGDDRRVGKPKGKAIENIHSVPKEEKKKNKLKKLNWATEAYWLIRKSSIWFQRVPEEKKERLWAEKKFKEIMTKNSEFCDSNTIQNTQKAPKKVGRPKY